MWSAGFSPASEVGGPSPVRAGARGGLVVCALEGKKRSTFQTVDRVSNIVRPRAHPTQPARRANQALLGTGTLAAGRPRVAALEAVEKVTFEALETVWERDSVSYSYLF